MKFVLRGAIKIKSEDGGQAQIAEIDDPRHQHLFVRIQSWDTSKRHLEMQQLDGKIVEVSIEVMEEVSHDPSQ